MNEELKKRCDIFASNREIIKKKFKWDSDLMCLIYAGSDVTKDLDELERCERLLRENTKTLSIWRGNVKVPTVCRMVNAEDPLAYFEKVQRIYGKLNAGKKLDSDYKAITSLIISDRVSEETEDSVVARTYEIWDVMKKRHKMLTSEEDIPMAAMLAVLEKDPVLLNDRADAAFDLLADVFKSKDARQSISHVIAMLDKDIPELCEKTKKIFLELKNKKHKYSYGFEAAVLGVVASLDEDAESLADEIMWADDYLKTKKGFGTFGVSNEARRMHAALLVLDSRNTDDRGTVAAASMIILIILEVLMMLLIMNTVMINTTVMN